MRTIRYVGLVGAVILALGCGEDKPPQTPPPPPATTTPPPPPPPATTAEAPPPPPKKPLAEMQKAAGKTMAEAYLAGDGTKLASLYTEDAVIKSFGRPDMKGRDAIKKDLENLSGAVTKIKLTESRVFVKGEIVVSEYVAVGQHTGPVAGVKPTEKPVGMQAASVYWFTPDGLIKEEHTYQNIATFFSQIGASKEKGRAVPKEPSGAPEVVVAKDSPEEKANIEVVEKINKAWEAKKEADVAALFTNDATWDDVTMLTPAKGTAEIKKYVLGFMKAFPDGKLATTNAWGFGDWVVEEGTYAGTHKGTLAGMAPTNKPFTIHEITIAKVGPDKKVVSATTYGNDVELMAQLDPKSLPKANPDPKADPKADPKKPDGKPDPKATGK